MNNSLMLPMRLIGTFFFFNFLGYVLPVFAQDLVVTGNTVIPEDESPSYDSITVESGGVLEIGGGASVTALGSIWVKSGGAIVAKGKHVTGQINDAWVGEGVMVTADTVTIDVGGSFHADGQGYASTPVGSYNSGNGPGGVQPGASLFDVNRGASHGGLASASNGSSRPAYGSMREPIELGSSSSGFLSPHAGGGAIRLIVTGTLTVDGVLSANGMASGNNHNGASGGSVWVTTSVLAGSGLIQANASEKGVAAANQRSAGGRVAVYYADAGSFSDLSKIEAKASPGNNLVEDGTVWLESTAGGKRRLTVFGRVDMGEDDLDPLDSITVHSGGIVEVTGGADLLVRELIHVMDGGQLVVEGKFNTDRVDGEWRGIGATLSTTEFSIDAGGVVSADGEGYKSKAVDGVNNHGTGPGESNLGNYSASYGGRGATNTRSRPSLPVYGSLTEPVDLGSSSYGFNSKTSGGGAIRLIVSDTLTVNGSLSANGLAEGNNHYGATGGSIWITSETLVGTGTIQANASGKGTTAANRNSGGGRIAIYYSDASGFVDLSNIEAKSGGDSDESEDGTVFLVDVDNGDGGLTVAGRVAIPEDEFLRLESVRVLESGLLEISGGGTLWINGALDTESGGELVFRSKGLQKNFKGEWVGEGSRLFAQTLTVPAGASISADGQGYLEGPGSQLRQFVNGAASHGGLGTGDVKPVYGSETMPLTPGSGGGAGVTGYTAGGGAMRIIVSESITLDGSITSNGIAEGTSQSGATGGSIWISSPLLTGSGTIQANAAESGTAAANNDSGGGRIAIDTISPLGIPLANVEALGGGEAANGTIFIDENGPMKWLTDLPSVLHGEIQLAWYAGALAAGESVRLLASKDGSDTPLLNSTNPGDIVVADLTALASGLYDLRLQVLDAGQGLVRELVSSHYIDNNLKWHSGVIDGEEVWAADTIHVIEDDLIIDKDASVTVSAGAIVKVLPDVKVTLLLNGRFTTEGTAEDPTLITSWFDDSAGGDTNQDGSSTNPTVNDWAGFVLDYSAVLELSVNTEVRYSRQTWEGELKDTHYLVKRQVHQITGDLHVQSWSKLVVEQGAILKLEPETDITFDRNTSFQTLGTPAEPVVITSMLDDDFGGDTNGDGSATAPAPGDWNKIETNIGESVVDNTYILYGGGLNTFGAIGNSGGTLHIRDSLVFNAFFDGITTRTGPVFVENTIVSGADRGIAHFNQSPLSIINSTIDNNRIGVFQHTGTEILIYNSIISNNLEYGVWDDTRTANLVVFKNTLLWNPNASEGNLGSVHANGPDHYNFTAGIDGNLVADPLLDSQDPFSGLRLLGGSPAIDAGSGSVAPEFDKLGFKRVNDPTIEDTGIPAGNGNVPDIGAYEFLEYALAGIDLEVVSVGNPGPLLAGDTVQVDWTVENLGSDAVTGPWYDRIYLSTGKTDGSRKILIGEVLVADGETLEAGASRSFNRTLSVPGAPVGSYFLQVTSNSRRSVFENNHGNNSGYSNRSASYDMNQLVLDSPYTGTFSGEGALQWVRFVADADGSIELSLSATDPNVNVELYAGLGYSPSRSRFNQRGSSIEGSSTGITLDVTPGQVYYLAIAGTELAGERGFFVTVEAAEIGLTGVSPAVVGNLGNATIKFTGSGFSADSVFRLEGPGGTINASEVTRKNGSVVFASFNCNGITTGSYSATVVQGEDLFSLNGAVEIVSIPGGAIEYSLDGPTAFRAGRKSKVTVTYENKSLNDVVAPLFIIEAVNARLSRSGYILKSPENSSRTMGAIATNFESGFQEAIESRLFLGIGDVDPIGVLPPGFVGELTFEVLPSTSSTQVQLEVFDLNPEVLIEWDQILKDQKPEEVSDAVWNRVLTNLTEATMRFESPVDNNEVLNGRELNAQLAATATYFGELGQPTANAARLLGEEVDRASFRGQLFRRDFLGPFGWGSNPLFAEAKFFPASDFSPPRITISHSFDKFRTFFFSELDGRYYSAENDVAIVDMDDEYIYIAESDGTQGTYSRNGKLLFIQNVEGHLIDFEYDESGRLVKYSDNQNRTISYEYNNGGRVSRIENANGDFTDYSYDAGNEYLTAIERSNGKSQSLTYDLNPDSASFRAIKRIVHDDDYTIDFAYDEFGRVSSIDLGERGGLLTFIHGDQSDATLLTESGEQLTIKTDLESLPIKVINDQNIVSSLRYDSAGFITRLEHENSNRFFSYSYDDNRSRTISSGPGGYVREVVYSSGLESKTTVIDSNSNAIEFEYTPEEEGQLLKAITFPDGSFSKFDYDDHLRVVRETDPKKQAIEYEWNEFGSLSRLDFSNGDFTKYSYDETTGWPSQIAETKGGLEKITQFEYDELGNLVKVTYPNGRSIDYTMNGSNLLESLETSEGFKQVYSYDEYERLKDIRIGQEAPLVEYEYDDFGRVVSILRNGGGSTLFEYGILNRVTRIEHLDESGVVREFFAYSYDKHGDIVSIEDASGITICGYDTLGRLTSFVYPNSRELLFEYDGEGNRRLTSENGETQTYEINSLNQYSSVDGSAFNYDLNGNLISTGSGDELVQYHYDHLNRLVQKESDGNTLIIEYDSLGFISAVERNGTREEYLVDPTGDGDIIAVYNGSGSLMSNLLYGHGLEVIDRTGEDPTFFHYDNSDNVRMVVNSSDTVLIEYVYLPFGELLEADESISNSWQFGARNGLMRIDDDLVYVRDRIYSTNLGRFLTRDRGLTPERNPYEYAFNDPIAYVDYTGFDTEGGGIGGFISDFLKGELTGGNILGTTTGLIDEVFGESPAWDDVIAHAKASAPPPKTSVSPPKASARKQKVEKARQPVGTRTAQRKAKALSKKSPVKPKPIAPKTPAKTPVPKVAKPTPPPKVSPPATNTVSKGTSLVGKFGKFIGNTGSVLGFGINAHDFGTKFKATNETFLNSAGNPSDYVLATSEVVGNGAEFVFKTLPSVVPGAGPYLALGSGYIYDGVKYGSDKGSQRLFAWMFDNPQDPNDVFASRFKNNNFEFYWRLQSRLARQNARSSDPNDKTTFGAGAGGFLVGETEITYRIRFENMMTAELAAQEVDIIDTLDRSLDLSTFRLIDLGFNGTKVEFSEDQQFADMIVPFDDTQSVKISIFVDPVSRIVNWNLRSIDPNTLYFPDDPTIGFLPPNDDAGSGEGFVHFAIAPKPDLVTGDSFTNKASIVFDLNEPIITNVVTNTIDKTPPTSSVDTLEGDQFETFKVTWTGDDGLGSGVEFFDVYYSVDGGEYLLWRERTELDSWIFAGELGKTYAFYSVATDGVGFIEAKDPIAEMTVTPNLEGSNYLVWAKDHFGIETINDPNLEEMLWGDNADPDSDGLINGLEFYTGSDPLIQDDELVKQVFASEDELIVRLRRSANAENIILIPEASNELSLWSQDIVTTQIVDIDGQSWLEARAFHSELIKTFMRFRIVN